MKRWIIGICVAVALVMLSACVPRVTIESPEDGASFEEAAEITFSGRAADFQGGDIAGQALVWTSSLDGTIGGGKTIISDSLSVGTHTITLTATDAVGASSSDTITINIIAGSGDDGSNDNETGGDTDNETGDDNDTAVWQPAPGTSWQWQLTGTIDTSFDVDMYDIDLFDTPQSVIDRLHADGRIVICSFSAGSWEDWRDDADRFPDSVLGDTLDDWPDEKWLDIRQLDILGPLMQARLDVAVAKKCDGVEPDNVDGYTNSSGFPLSAADQLVFNRWLADQAHARGLSVGLKNDLDQVEELVSSFDWALNEQCFQYNECDLLLPFIEDGKAVFGVEYELDTDAFCSEAKAMDFDWLKKKYDLDATRESCR